MDNQLSPQGGSMPSSQLTLDPDQKQKLMLIEAEQKSGLTVDPVDFSKLSGEQNRGISKVVQSVVGEDIESFSSPITSREDLIARGFLDNSLKPTSKGEGAVALIKRGMLNKDFTLNDNSKLLLTKPNDFFTPDNAEAQSTYSSYFENNPEQYNKMLQWKKAKEIGLFDEEANTAQEKPFWDTAWDKTKALGEMVSNVGKIFGAIGDIGTEDPKKAAESSARLQGLGEGFVETAAQSFMNQSAWINKGVNAVLEKTGVLTKEQEDAQNTFNEYKAASFKNFFNKTKTVAALSSAVGIDDAANQLAYADQILGKEQSQKIQEQGQQVGSLAGDITNIELGPLMQIGGMAVGSGSKLLGSVLNAKRIKQVQQASAMAAESSVYEAKAAEAAANARVAHSEIITSSELEGVSRTYGDTSQAIAHEANKVSWTKQAAEATTQAEQHAGMAQTLRETANGLENTLPPTFGSKIVNAGKLPVALPLKAVGFAAKKFGDTLASVDRGASSFLETFGLDKYRGLARAASIFTGNVNPLSIAEGVVASNKLWNGAGRLLDSVGENMLVNQGTVPFFRRVADDMATPWGKTFATQLDNFVPPVARGVGAISKGIAGAAAPSLVYEAINHQGLDANVFKQAATDALVFGGVHGVFKAATIGGARDFNAVKAGDRANFNERLKNADPEQYDIYNSKVDPSTKDLISSFSGAYPNAQIKFVTEGPSYQTGSVATFNVNAPREHAGVIALHELKHVLQNEFQLDEAILAHMVGNKTRGGEIFTKDGSLDPEFVKFSNEYNNRIKALGQPELGVHDLAIEFYTDKAAEVLKSDIKSGEFTKRAQESQLSRTVKSHFSSLVNQVPIIKNIHIKTGGAIDSSGRLVKGSGLLSEGFTQSKDVQAMVRKLYRETAGVSKPVVSVAQEGAAMRQPRATKSTREGINNGTSAIEKVNRDSRAAGLEIPEGALDPSTVRGRDGVPTALQTKAIIDSGAIHPDHLGTFPMLVGEMRPDSTSTFLFHYRPAEQGRTAQSAAGETFHHIKPVGVRTNKKGNVLISALDINLWDQNIKKVANSKPSKDLGYTEKQLREDSYEASRYHIKNQSPDAYFEQKYGKAQALKRKSLVASTYGAMTEKQHGYNPLLSEVGMGRPDHVYRTFSLDDIKSATRTNSSVNLSFDPNNYYSLKVNLMPEAPIVDRSGNIIENPAMKDFFENHLPNGKRFRTAENVKFATPPSEAAAKNALSSSKQPFFGEHRNLKEGTNVGVRIDIPAFLSKGEYVQTVHKKGTTGNVGERIGYDTHVRLKDGVRFFVKEGSATEKGGAVAIKEGRANKHPIATVEGKISSDRSVPTNINEWTPVGMDPKKHSYFYDKVTNEPVVGGSESYSVGNTVFVKDPIYAEKSQFRYMPEPMKKPYGPNDTLPSFETTVVKGETQMKGFKWDKATNVVYDIGGGKSMSFSYDPAYLVKPKFGNPEKLLKGQAVIMLEADKARATGGDMGGVNFPNLRSNHVTVKGPDGIDYRVKWANMTSTFVSGSKNRMQSHGAKYALIQLMDDFALKSNKRTARTLDGAMREANLSTDHNNMIAMAMNYGIIVGKKQKLSSTATALRRALNDATPAERTIINEKINSTLAERDALNPSPDEMAVFKSISNVKTAMSNVATGRWKQKTIDNAFENLQSHKGSDAYNKIMGRIQSPYVYDNIGNTFTDRGAAVGSITSVKLGNFNVEKIMRDSSDFKEAKNLDIVSAVELSQNPDFFALYFGKDPLQEAAMSVSERSARDKMLADNNFQVHESYDWAMIGPAKGGDFIFDKPVRPETIFKKYRSVHEKESVRSGSEETVAGAMRKSAEYKLTAYGDTVKMIGEEKTRKVKKIPKSNKTK